MADGLGLHWCVRGDRALAADAHAPREDRVLGLARPNLRDDPADVRHHRERDRQVHAASRSGRVPACRPELLNTTYVYYPSYEIAKELFQELYEDNLHLYDHHSKAVVELFARHYTTLSLPDYVEASGRDETGELREALVGLEGARDYLHEVAESQLAIIEEINAAALERQTLIDDLTTTVEAQRRALSAHAPVPRAEIEALERAAADRLSLIDKLTTTAYERLALVEEIRAEADSRNAVIEDLRATAAARLALIEDLGAALAIRDAIVDDLSATAAERLAVIERISAEAESRAAVIDTLRATADERLALVEAIRVEADSRNAVIEDLRATAAERLAVIERIGAEAESRAAVIDTLRATADDRLTLIETLDASLRRITASRPLRMLRRLRGATRGRPATARTPSKIDE